MRILPTRILTCALFILLGTSFAWAQEPPPPAPPPTPAPATAPEVQPPPTLTPTIQTPPTLNANQIDSIRRLIDSPELVTGDPVAMPPGLSPLEHAKQIVGLPKESRPEVLTWERIYGLAVSRVGPAQEEKEGLPGFAQFRDVFLGKTAGAGGKSFRDPAAAVLDLFGRIEKIDNANRNVQFHENIRKLVLELIQGESAGLHQLDVDAISASLTRVNEKQAHEISQFRDRLDDLKVALGLSPHKQVVLQRPNPAAFRLIRNELDTWNRRPDRSLQELPTIIRRMPVLGEVLIEGQPILGKLAKSPEMTEEILTRAATLATKNRGDRAKMPDQGDAAVQLELRMRHRLRNLLEKSRSYERAKESYKLAIRLQDQTFERLVAPSSAVASSRSPIFQMLIEVANDILVAEDRLVSLWTSFRIERLELYRDLGELPYGDWPTFFADLSPVSAISKAVPAAVPSPAAGKPVTPQNPSGHS